MQPSASMTAATAACAAATCAAPPLRYYERREHGRDPQHDSVSLIIDKCDSTKTTVPDSDDDEGDECIEYDVYGWCKFESGADGVQRLHRQWVLHLFRSGVRDQIC